MFFFLVTSAMTDGPFFEGGDKCNVGRSVFFFVDKCNVGRSVFSFG